MFWFNLLYPQETLNNLIVSSQRRHEYEDVWKMSDRETKKWDE